MAVNLVKDQKRITDYAIRSVMPDEAVRKALVGFECSGRLILVSVGKAGWQMAKAAEDILGERISDGIVVTKYDHAKGALKKCKCFEAGHPTPDENTVKATTEVLKKVKGLSADDVVLFLVSGGASSLFEIPVTSLSELQSVTDQLLSSGASITEINAVRKHLSKVKGGRFAKLCEPALVKTIILSDVLGDDPSVIASGPSVQDSSTCKQAMAVVQKYKLKISEEALKELSVETPKLILNSSVQITGSVRELCKAAKEACTLLGYTTTVLTDELACEAKDAGEMLGLLAKNMQTTQKSRAFILGGETVVRLKGKGKGGRNQEIALAASKHLQGCANTCVFSVGSDGTDGPTDAAGGYADTDTADTVKKATGRTVTAFLSDNDAYNALKASDGLIMTGPTGTNVNDFSVLLIKR